MRLGLTLAAIAFALFAIGLPSQLRVASAADQTVEVGNLWFCSPSFENGVCTTTINVGDTVTWSNVAGFHTVTECAEGHDPCPLPGGFNSGQLEAGDTFSFTFNNAGSFEYYCAFHPSEMRGVVVVQQPTPTPSPAGQPTADATTPPATTPAPVSVPRTGGAPGAGEGSSSLLLAAGFGFLLAAAAISLASVRRAAR